jgi:hypothetical protein
MREITRRSGKLRCVTWRLNTLSSTLDPPFEKLILPTWVGLEQFPKTLKFKAIYRRRFSYCRQLHLLKIEDVRDLKGMIAQAQRAYH